jgi:hypothetical protein
LETLPEILQEGTPKRDTFRKAWSNLRGWRFMQNLEKCGVIRDLVGLLRYSITNERRD